MRERFSGKRSPNFTVRYEQTHEVRAEVNLFDYAEQEGRRRSQAVNTFAR